MHRNAVRLLVAIFLSWMLTNPVLADLTGDLQGTVTDATGAGVANAKVTLKNLRTGATRMVASSPTGEFSAPQMEIGEYARTSRKTASSLFRKNL